MLNPEYQEAHNEARLRFDKEPTKCYQRHIREVWGEAEAKTKLTSLNGARVEPIDNDVASEIILKYEWLQKMASGTKWCYGLFLNGELLGAACFNKAGNSPDSRNLLGKDFPAEKVACLARGACVPHAPKDAGSFLTRWACKRMNQEHGHQVFFAYSDPSAGEIGTIYQAVGWHYLGVGAGRTAVGGEFFHTNFISPEGKKYSSYALYKHAVKLGWTEKLGITKRDYLRNKGYTAQKEFDKARWVWLEGAPREKKRLLKQCRYPFLPYPKRIAERHQDAPLAPPTERVFEPPASLQDFSDWFS